MYTWEEYVFYCCCMEYSILSVRFRWLIMLFKSSLLMACLVTPSIIESSVYNTLLIIVGSQETIVVFYPFWQFFSCVFWSCFQVHIVYNCFVFQRDYCFSSFFAFICCSLPQGYLFMPTLLKIFTFKTHL